MSDIFVNGVTTDKAVVGNNCRVGVSGTRDGAIYTADWELSKALEGKVFQAQVGTLTTPVTFRIGIDLDQPELVIDVPTGTTIIPVSIDVYLEDAAGTDNEIVAASNPALCGAGSSTLGTILPKRLNGSFASACKMYYTYSGDCVDPASYDEFWRTGNAFAQAAAVQNRFTWNRAVSPPPVIVGPASLVLWVDGTTTAPAGFIKVVWVEDSSSNV